MPYYSQGREPQEPAPQVLPPAGYVSGDDDLARVLIARGADPTLRDALYNGAPDGWATHHGYPELAAFLKEERAKREKV